MSSMTSCAIHILSEQTKANQRGERLTMAHLRACGKFRDDTLIEAVGKLKKARLIDTNSLCPAAVPTCLNEVGTLASDFVFEMPGGERSRLSAIKAEYLILYFYDINCPESQKVKRQIELSAPIQSLLSGRRMKIMSLYPYTDRHLWRKNIYDMPVMWINAFDPDNVVNGSLYDLAPLPSIYLLGSNKRVILREAGFDELEAKLLGEV